MLLSQLKPSTPFPDVTNTNFFAHAVSWYETNDGVAAHTYYYQSCKYKFANLAIDRKWQLDSFTLNPDATWTMIQSPQFRDSINLFPKHNHDTLSLLFMPRDWSCCQTILNSMFKTTNFILEFPSSIPMLEGPLTLGVKHRWHRKGVVVEYRKYDKNIYRNCIHAYKPESVLYSEEGKNSDFCIVYQDIFNLRNFTLSVYFWSMLNEYLDTV